MVLHFSGAPLTRRNPDKLTRRNNQEFLGKGISLSMLLRKPFTQTLLICVAFGIWSLSVIGQTIDTRSRAIAQGMENDISCSVDDPVIISTVEVVSSKPKKAIELNSGITSPEPSFLKFQPLMLAAIDQRLGAPYVWGATGPSAFDCSGFIWSIFQSAGITFERGSARTLWARFTPATPEEQYKFGTLVFFSGLAHVGVVADQFGFYHASRHHGVVYSPFNDYWLARIDGFRRVPLPASQTTD